jgi:hypothetical protein
MSNEHAQGEKRTGTNDLERLPLLHIGSDVNFVGELVKYQLHCNSHRRSPEQWKVSGRLQ